ncbi:HesB/IscA family protein [Acetobacter persici]|uniref:HesB/IscA family protein n=1 Tax=Acetobacter persici TaxID=1076596 RepID=UPI001BAE202E|nr:iron-sulfur cluster assembly accessory protein [Acetobacter persici]MBS1016523.1 iron-sulfur cluster assembly accessory protein [Acetobacter persici]MCG0997140.1 iron-sulfur cluster assembly accessory protein [Acetobacter persici]
MTQPLPFSVSDAAAARIARVIATRTASASTEGKAPPAALRVAVEAGGCNGFQYQFRLIGQDDIAADDIRLDKGEALVIVDPVSLDLLAGAELDFADKLMGAHFTVNNPNAASSCGCGTSFSVA